MQGFMQRLRIAAIHQASKKNPQSPQLNTIAFGETLRWNEFRRKKIRKVLR